MLAKSLIEPEIPTLKTSDTGEFALNTMFEFKVSHLAIVNHEDFLGLISEDDILELDDNAAAIGSYKLSLHKVYIKENKHIYDIIKLIAKHNLSLIPVLNDSEKYLGSITLQNLTQQFYKLASLKNSGGIIVLELSVNDYSMAEIARIIESNDAKIVSSYITSHEDSTKLDITLKLNVTDLTRIIKAFNRYNYLVKNIFHESEFTDELKERYDSFMHYLNI